MRPGSQVRILLTRLMVATGIALLATIALIWWQFEHSSTIVLNRGLGEKLQVIQDHLRLDDQGRLVETLPAEEKRQFDEHLFFPVSDAEGRAFLSVPPGHENSYHPFEPDLGDDPQFFEHNYLHSGENYLGVTSKIALDDHDYWLQLVEEVPHWENFFHYSKELVLSGVGILIVLHFSGFALIAYLTISKSFKPVERAAREAQKVTPGNIDARITADDLPSEVVPLAKAVNGALDRLENALASQKHFVADAAHELLTPVSIMRAEVEMIEDRALAKSLLVQMEDLTGMVSQLLELSELEGEDFPTDAEFDLRETSESVLAKLAPLAIRIGIEPSLSGTERPVMVKGCPRAMGSALGNLVANAIQHGTGATRLEVIVEDDGRVSVVDDGPGIPVHLRASVFERFRRHSARVAGSGLGLAIVRRIVEAHRGSIDVTDGPDGKGAAFIIQLPVAGSAKSA